MPEPQKDDMLLVAILFLQIASIILGFIVASILWFARRLRSWTPYIALLPLCGALGFWILLIVLEYYLWLKIHPALLLILGYALGETVGIPAALALSRRLKQPVPAVSMPRPAGTPDVLDIIVFASGVITIIAFILYCGGFGESIFLKGRYPTNLRELIFFVILMGWVISPYAGLAVACSLIRRSQSSVARLASIRVTSLIILVLSIAYYFQVCFPATPKHLDITPYFMFPILLFIVSPLMFAVLNGLLTPIMRARPNR